MFTKFTPSSTRNYPSLNKSRKMEMENAWETHIHKKSLLLCFFFCSKEKRGGCLRPYSWFNGWKWQWNFHAAFLFLFFLLICRELGEIIKIMTQIEGPSSYYASLKCWVNGINLEKKRNFVHWIAKALELKVKLTIIIFKLIGKKYLLETTFLPISVSMY